MIKHPAIHHCLAQQQGVISFWGLQMAEPGWGRVCQDGSSFFTLFWLANSWYKVNISIFGLGFLLVAFGLFSACSHLYKSKIARWMMCSNPMKNRILAKGSFRKVKLVRLRWKLHYHHLTLFIKSVWQWGFKTTTFPIQLRFHGHDKHLQRLISTAQKGSKKRSGLSRAIIGAIHSRTPLSAVVRRSRHRERFKMWWYLVAERWKLKS